MNAPRLIMAKIQTGYSTVSSRLLGRCHPGNGWRSALQSSVSELDTLARSTEGEFLSIGARLHDFYGRAGEISRISSSVTGMMSGEAISAAMDGFREVISRIKELESKSGFSLETLQRVEEILSDLSLNLYGFQKTVRSLRIFCVATRIETASLGDRDIGFNVLADEVEKLASEIEEKHCHLLERTESLARLVGETLLRVSGLLDRQKARASTITGKTLSNLESLTEKHASSSISAINIGTRYESVTRSIGEIVASMQFHDITRQRLEHATGALAAIACEDPATNAPPSDMEGEAIEPGQECVPVKQSRFILRRLGKREDDDKSKETLALACGICELQIAQLRNARDGLIRAVDNIATNLRGVADLVIQIVQETQQMAGTADETGRSFLSKVESGFSSVESAFSEYTQVDRELASIMSSLGDNLGDMSTFASGIESTGHRIKLIALNSIVKAANIGHEGRTLGVLAEAIHKLSVETCTRTETVCSALQAMTSLSESLRAAITSHEGSEAADAHELLHPLLSGLQTANQGVVALLARMNGAGEALSEDILKTVETITVHKHVNSVISGVVSRLEEIIASTPVLSSHDGQAHTEIETLQASYTMQEEREVHQSFLMAGVESEKRDHDFSSLPLEKEAKTETHEGKTGEESDEDDLGDNVELF